MLISSKASRSATNSAEFAKRANIGTQNLPVDFLCLYSLRTALGLPGEISPRTAWTARSLSRRSKVLRALGVKQGCSFLHRSSRCTVHLVGASFPGAPVCDRPANAEQPVIGQPDLVGHCVSLLPFVVDLQEAETISDFLARVQRELGAAHDHSAFTLVSLLQDLRPGVAVPGVHRFPPD